MRQPGRTAATAAALMIGVALVTFASIFAASARKTIHDCHQQRLARASSSCRTPTASRRSRRWRPSGSAQVPGVDKRQPVRFFQRQGRHRQGRRRDRRSTRRRSRDLYSGGGTEQLRNLKPRRGLVSKSFARRPRIPASATAASRRATGQTVPLKVAGIYNDKGHLLSDLTVDQHAGGAATSRAAKDNFVFIGGDRAARRRRTRSRRALKTDFPQTEALTNKEFIDNQAGQINQLLALIYALLALAIIVSLFGIVNTLVLSITERTRELGMLRAIGTSRRQVRRMIRYEAIITAMLGGILGAVLGVVLALAGQPAAERLQALDPVRQPARAADPERVRRRAGRGAAG